MFGKLKSAVGGSPSQKIVDKISPLVNQHLEKVLELAPGIVNDDEQFTKIIIDPAYLAVAVSAGGMTKLIPKFEARFTMAFLHVRDKLVVIDGDTVSLVNDLPDKLKETLLESLNKA